MELPDGVLDDWLIVVCAVIVLAPLGWYTGALVTGTMTSVDKNNGH